MATSTQLASGNWRVQVRRKTRYVAETFRRRKDGEEWALEMERNIDRNGSSKPRALRNVRTFGDLIDLHDQDMHEVGRPPRRSKAAVLEALKESLGSEDLLFHDLRHEGTGRLFGAGLSIEKVASARRHFRGDQVS